MSGRLAIGGYVDNVNPNRNAHGSQRQKAARKLAQVNCDGICKIAKKPSPTTGNGVWKIPKNLSRQAGDGKDEIIRNSEKRI